MKTKSSKQPKQSKPTVQLKDIKPKKDAKAGATPRQPATTGGILEIRNPLGL